MTKYFLIAILCVGSTISAGCGKNEPSSPAPAPAQAPAAAQEAVKAAPAAPMPLNAASVDTCALIARADVEAVVGPLAQDPKADQPQGSLLGGCDFMTADYTSVSVSARPAREFDATVKYAGEKAALQPVAGLGEKAFQTRYGLMIQPAGKPYFLTVVVLSGGAMNAALSLDIARKLKL